MKKQKYKQDYLTENTREFACYSFPSYKYNFKIYIVEIIYSEEHDTVFDFTYDGTNKKYFTRKLFHDEQGFYIRFVQSNIYLQDFTLLKRQALVSSS